MSELCIYRTENGTRTAIVLQEGPKWIHLGVIEGDGYHHIKVPASERRYLKPIEWTRQRRAIIRRVAKRAGTRRALRKQILEVLL